MKNKRTSITIPSKTKTQLTHLSNIYKDSVGYSNENMINFIFSKIIKGDYSHIKPEKQNDTSLIYGDMELKREANKIAKNQGFAGTKDMLEHIIRHEYFRHTRNESRESSVQEFLKVGDNDE